MRRLGFIVSIPAVAVSGLCACVGPNFHPPAPPATDRYTISPLPAETAGGSGPASVPVSGPTSAAQRFLLEQEVPRNWWTLFKSPPIDALVAAALRANPDIASAKAALRQAQENAAAQRGGYLPTVQAEFDASRNHDALGVLSPTLASPESYFNLYRPQVTVSYVPDVFGANRRAVEAAVAQVEVSRDLLDATYLTLAANVVTAAIQEAGLKSQIEATQRVIALEQESLTTMRHQRDLGAIAEGDVYAQEAALAQMESQLPPLLLQRQKNLDLLATLTGQLPSALQAPVLSLDEISLPQDLPLGVPSQLVRRRPDVRAAEAQLHAATAAVGISIANLLPQVMITADLGSSATMLSDLFKAGTGFWSAGASATQTLFAGGALIHKKRAADAALDLAGAGYKSAVLTAFRNVADSLHALQADADALNLATRSVEASRKSWDVARRQLQIGSVSPLILVVAEQTHLQALVAQAQARANRLADTAALFQALGGSVTPP